MNSGSRWCRTTGKAMLAAAALAMLTGCLETDSFLDPSVVGRWESTPVTLPILDRLDVIEPPIESHLSTTPVRPEDLIPDMREYVIGPGDTVQVAIFELIVPGAESVNTRRVTETGRIRLPVVGAVRAAGLSASQLEEEIIDILEEKAVLRDATVSAVLLDSRQNTYSVLGEPRQGGTAVGTYVIPKPDFRLLDALALARGVPGRTKTIQVIRQTALSAQVAGDVGAILEQEELEEATPPAPRDAPRLIEELMEGLDEEPLGTTPTEDEDRPEAPAPVAGGLDDSGRTAQWVYAGGKWVKVEPGAPGPSTPLAEVETFDEELGRLITQRIIEIPYSRLSEGDMRYNIIIRPGDVIKVPAPQAGFVYIMGQISRPGAYTIPGEQDLTLKQLIASAGNLSALAIPQRVDLIRRVGISQEATLRLDLAAIFNGTEPDIFLKQDDLINIGTNFWAVPLAVFRNGLRSSYGFGFVIDRNFAGEVFGTPN